MFFSHLSQSLSIFCNFFIYFFSSLGIHQCNHLHEWHAITSNSLSIYFLYTLHYFYLLYQVKSLFSRFLRILSKTNQSGTWKTIIKSFFAHPKGFIPIRAIFQHRRIFWNKTFTNFVGSSSNLGNLSTNIYIYMILFYINFQILKAIEAEAKFHFFFKRFESYINQE